MENNYQPQQPQYNKIFNGGSASVPSSMGQNTIPPKNYLAFAILTTICCCLPTGIYAIIRSTKVNSYYAMGQYNLALEASEDAKRWSIIGLLIGIIWQIICFALAFFTTIMEYL